MNVPKAILSTACLGLALAQAAAAAPAPASAGRVLRVGASEQLKTPSAAAALAHDGDTIEIATGTLYIGNIIQHGTHAENGVAISYAAEGAKNTSQDLQVVNNTYINERKASASFLRVAGQTTSVRAINNLIIGSKTVLTGPGEASNNLVTDAPGFADAARLDFRLGPQSPARGAGIDPGKSGEFNLTPAFFYKEPLGSTPRAKGDKLNIGACAVAGK